MTSVFVLHVPKQYDVSPGFAVWGSMNHVDADVDRVSILSFLVHAKI